jgi:hypothetical protein
MNEEPIIEIESEKDNIDVNIGLLPKEELKRPGLSLLSLFVAGAVMMLLWWGISEIGFRWSLSVLVVSILYLFNARLQERKISTSSWILLGLTLLAGLIPALRNNEYNRLLSMLVSFVCLALLSADFFSGQWWQYRVREYLKAAFSAMAGFFVGFPAIASQAIKSNGAPEQKASGKRLAFGILKGILITLPLLLVFTFLFAYADAIFESKVDSLFEWLRADFLSQFLGRVLLTLFFTWLLGAALWLVMMHSSKLKAIEPDTPLLKPFLGMTETMITLVSLNLLFAFFLVIQFQYLFAGEANITQVGFTYAQYAERGFRELLLVAAIAGLVFYALASFTRRESKTKKLIFSILGGFLLLQVGVVLVSAYQRILMYIHAYGLTAYRYIPQIFIFFLAAILLSLVVMELTNKFKRLALVLLSASLLFVVTLAVLNVDTSIARHNIERAMEGEKLDYAYLVNGISSDADPYLFETVQSGNLPQDLQDNLEKVMVCRSADFEANRSYLEDSLLNLNLSIHKANVLYENNQDLLKKWPLENIDPVNHYLGFNIAGEDIFCAHAEAGNENSN